MKSKVLLLLMVFDETRTQEVTGGPISHSFYLMKQETVEEGDYTFVMYVNDEKVFEKFAIVHRLNDWTYDLTVTAQTLTYNEEDYTYTISDEKTLYQVGEMIELLSTFKEVYVDHEITVEVSYRTKSTQNWQNWWTWKSGQHDFPRENIGNIPMQDFLKKPNFREFSSLMCIFTLIQMIFLLKQLSVLLKLIRNLRTTKQQ